MAQGSYDVSDELSTSLLQYFHFQWVKSVRRVYGVFCRSGSNSMLKCFALRSGVFWAEDCVLFAVFSGTSFCFYIIFASRAVNVLKTDFQNQSELHQEPCRTCFKNRFRSWNTFCNVKSLSTSYSTINYFPGESPTRISWFGTFMNDKSLRFRIVNIGLMAWAITPFLNQIKKIYIASIVLDLLTNDSPSQIITHLLIDNFFMTCVCNVF